MAPLDGKEAVKPVAFDAHEQAQAAQAADYDHQEYPKAVDHVDHPSGVGQEPVLVQSAEEEKAYLEAKAAEKAEPVPAAETADGE